MQNNISELWESFEEYPLYIFSSLGRIKNIKTNKIHGQDLHKKKNGYLKAKLVNKNGKKKNIYVHRVVWQAFNGKIPFLYVIHHLNRNRLDNTINNLACVSRRRHKLIHRILDRIDNNKHFNHIAIISCDV